MKVAIEILIPEADRRRFKAATADAGTNMSEVARQLFAAYCDEQDAAKTTEAGDGHAG